MRFSSNPVLANHNGGPAYSLDAKQELVKACLTSFLSKDFYESERSKIDRIADLVSKVPEDFALKLAAFSRDYGLRSVNHVIFAEVAKWLLRGKPGIRSKLSNALALVAKRPDELSEIVWYYAISTGQDLNSVKLPNALKSAIASRLSNFSSYQLAKYRGKSSDFNLYDLVNSCHPVGNEQLKGLVSGKLESADTWEKEISEKGNNKESWLRLVSENKLGALALVRNFRNMMQCGISQEELSEFVLKADFSKIFPFQAIQALDACYEAGFYDGILFETVLGKAKESFKFIAERFPGKVAIGVDVSWSMFGSAVSKLSKMDRAKMAVAYGMLIRELTDGDMFLWSSDCVGVDVDASFSDLMLEASRRSGGTYVSEFTNSIEDCGYDYAIVITDEQSGVPLVNVAKKWTVAWGIHDYKDTVASGNGVTAFYGYDDIMWKVSSDIFRLGELVSHIEKTYRI